MEVIHTGDLIAYEQDATQWITGEVVAVDVNNIRIKLCDATFTLPVGVDMVISTIEMPPLFVVGPNEANQLTEYIKSQIRLIMMQAETEEKVTVKKELGGN